MLVVDDDDEVRRLLVTVLVPRGYEVREARNGQEAVALCRAEVPRLVVLDHFMPIMDGATFLTEIDVFMARRPPVILFTAAHDDGAVARRLGVDVYVEKPVELARFVKLVDAMVRSAPRGMLAPARVDGRERRGWKRVLHRRAIEVRTPQRAGTAKAFIVDVSEGGMSIELAADIDAVINGYLAIVIGDGAQRVEIDARIRHAGKDRVGVQFFALDASRRAAIEALLDEARGDGEPG